MSGIFLATVQKEVGLTCRVSIYLECLREFRILQLLLENTPLLQHAVTFFPTLTSISNFLDEVCSFCLVLSLRESCFAIICEFPLHGGRNLLQSFLQVMKPQFSKPLLIKSFGYILSIQSCKVQSENKSNQTSLYLLDLV